MDYIKPFKFWCQKVIPLVYDDSLSYYETLCKISQKLNETIDLSNENNDLLDKLYSIFINFVENSSEIETFVNVVKYGVPNDGVKPASTAINNLLSLEELKGRTFYFPKGVYLIDSTVELNIGDGTSIFCDGDAVFKANNSLETLINLSGNNESTKRSFIMNGTFDCNNQVENGWNITDGVRNIMFLNCVITKFTKTGIKISESGSNHLFFDTIKIYANNNNITTGLDINTLDDFFSNLSIQSIIGINLHNRSGHKFQNVHMWSQNDITEEMFKNSIGIKEPGACEWSNLYIDTYYRGVTNCSGFYCSNLYVYWYASDNIANTDPVGVVSSSNGMYISNYFFNNINIPNGRAISSPDLAVDAYNFVAESRLKVSGIKYRKSGFPDLGKSNACIDKMFYNANSEFMYIGAILNINCCFTLTFRFTDNYEKVNIGLTDGVLKCISSNTTEIELAYGNTFTDGNFEYIPIYAKSLNNKRYTLTCDGGLFVYHDSDTLATGTSLGERITITTKFMNNFSGTLYKYNLYDHNEYSGSISRDSGSTTTTLLNQTNEHVNSCVLGTSNNVVYVLTQTLTTLNIVPAFNGTIDFTRIKMPTM